MDAGYNRNKNQGTLTNLEIYFIPIFNGYMGNDKAVNLHGNTVNPIIISIPPKDMSAYVRAFISC